jgi:DNA-binding CsgD family transcriptional regulator
MLLLISGRAPKEMAREMSYSQMGIYKVIYRLRRRYKVTNNAQLALAYLKGERNAG